VADALFDTWEGDDSTFEGDLTRVLKKHGIEVEGLSDEQLTVFVTATLGALTQAKGNSSEFVTSMFMLYKETEIGLRRRAASQRAARVPARVGE
jgi:5-enolpyruvylshikimate-3-phosphate synthase